MAKIAVRPPLARIIEQNFTDQVAFLSRMVQTKSANPFSPGESRPDVPVEKDVAELIFHKLAEMGCSVRKVGMSPERPNIVCYYGDNRGRKSLMWNGHMDTLPPGGTPVLNPFSGTVRQGKMYGLGVLDMKATLSAYIFALKALMEAKTPLKGRLVLTFVVDEEPCGCSEYGTKYLLDAGVTAKAALIGEPGSANVAIGHRGLYRFRIRVKGQSVHTGISDWERGTRGRNAIVDMARVISALQDLEIPYKTARIFAGRKPVFTFPTKIQGGVAVNVVPDACEAYGDVRLLPGNSDTQVKLLIMERLRSLGATFEIDDLVFVPSVEIDPREEVVTSLLKAGNGILKETPQLKGVGPGNDGWMLIKRDIPTICGFGPDGGGEHAYDEWVDLESLRRVTEIYARMAIVYLNS